MELFAVVQGLLWTTTVDRSSRRVHVYTDSAFVEIVMRHVAGRLKLPDRKSYRSVMDLYTQACDLSSVRTVTAGRRSVGDLHHAACDRIAKQQFRTYCSQERFARTILLKRAEARRTEIVNQILQTERLVEKLHNRLLACEMEIGAMRTTPGEEHASASRSPLTALHLAC